MELVSPAGNLEKLRFAYLYGADAAYIGVKDFSLRAKADNLSGENYAFCSEIKNGKKLYGAVNMYFREADLEKLEQSLDFLSISPFDAFIVSDLGAYRVLKDRFPHMKFHLSTQANCMNSDAVRFYRDIGFSRIILGREATLTEIESIKTKVPDVELEVFAHGAMCLAYSGRCFLSSYMAERSANRGSCAHPCRWDYKLIEEGERPGEFFPVFEQDGFTTILSSKDLCLFDHIRELHNAGIDSLKIEGRMKSVYYTALVTRSYRKAIDAARSATSQNSAFRNGFLEDAMPAPLEAYRNELFKVSRREFTTGFLFGSQEVNIPTKISYRRDYQFLGTVNTELEAGVYEIEVKNRMRSDDTIEYIGPDILFIRDTAFTLCGETGEVLEKANHGNYCTLHTDKPLKPGYIIRKKMKEDGP
jgi:U32 family peptidase